MVGVVPCNFNFNTETNTFAKLVTMQKLITNFVTYVERTWLEISKDRGVWKEN